MQFWCPKREEITSLARKRNGSHGTSWRSTGVIQKNVFHVCSCVCIRFIRMHTRYEIWSYLSYFMVIYGPYMVINIWSKIFFVNYFRYNSKFINFFFNLKKFFFELYYTLFTIWKIYLKIIILLRINGYQRQYTFL